MGRTGTCFDNAITESFFASLKCELIDRRTFRTRSEAERALFSYIEGFLQPAPPSLRQRPAQPRRNDRRHALKNTQGLDYAAA